MSATKINDLQHPEYSECLLDWIKWRLVFEGGQSFLDEYLVQFSSRERQEDFDKRKSITPIAAFATAALVDIKNSIYQRTAEVVRLGGDPTYQDACAGFRGGVDMLGATMNYFIGRHVLLELMLMSKVAVFVDMPRIPEGATQDETAGKRPYLYVYTAEEIKSWSYMQGDRCDELRSVLLEEDFMLHCPITLLPNGKTKRCRYLWVDEATNQVWMRYYDCEGNQVDAEGNKSSEDIPLNISRIPLVIMRITDSLMEPIANHQIALTNLESSDVAYAAFSNVPFYVEQGDSSVDGIIPYSTAADDSGAAGTSVSAGMSQTREIKVGHTQGRSYSGDKPPAFINPSAEPLRVSMEKQDKLKNDVRSLVNLALSNTKQHVASAESKQLDERGLEAGLSNIGLELEQGERLIARIWAEYMGKGLPASVKYPEKYTLKSEAERREEAKSCIEIIPRVASQTARREIMKHVVDLLVGAKVSQDTLEEIYKEIETCKFISGDSKEIVAEVNAGILSAKLAAVIRGYPETEPQEAAKDHAAKLKRIADSQIKVADAQADNQADLQKQAAADAAKEEKKMSADNTQSGDSKPAQRGPGK